MENLNLFDEPVASIPGEAPRQDTKALGQYFTPAWAAQELTDRFIASEKPGTLIEPSCGDGRFLGAIPRSLPACGVEIDPYFAQHARDATGRPVITSSFQDVTENQYEEVGVGEVNHFIGNPPFSMKLILEFLDVIYGLSGRHAVCGFILPSFVFQTANTVARKINRQWGIEQQIIPRDLFPGLSTPILWAIFRKHSPNKGFVLFDEKFVINALRKECREVLDKSQGTWKELVKVTLSNLGGKASVRAIYSALDPESLPEGNNFWQAKVRQTLQRYGQFQRVERGIWELVE